MAMLNNQRVYKTKDASKQELESLTMLKVGNVHLRMKDKWTCCYFDCLLPVSTVKKVL